LYEKNIKGIFKVIFIWFLNVGFDNSKRNETAANNLKPSSKSPLRLDILFVGSFFCWTSKTSLRNKNSIRNMLCPEGQYWGADRATHLDHIQLYMI